MVKCQESGIKNKMQNLKKNQIKIPVANLFFTIRHVGDGCRQLRGGYTVVLSLVSKPCSHILRLTVKPAPLLAEPGLEEVGVGVAGEVVADSRYTGYQQRSAPGVQLVEAQTARLLALIQGARSDVPATDNNLVTILIHIANPSVRSL